MAPEAMDIFSKYYNIMEKSNPHAKIAAHRQNFMRCFRLQPQPTD
jgi:hypothetical protein